jgi:quercetin dioxygenase-like cupin family protein
MNLKDMVPHLPDGMTDVKEILLQTADIPWREKSLNGLWDKMLWRAENDQGSIALIKFEKGVGIPAPHSHESNQFMFVLEGHYEYTATGVNLKAGSFYWNLKGNVHGPTIAHEETIYLEIYDGPHYPQRPSWYSDDEDAR